MSHAGQWGALNTDKAGGTLVDINTHPTARWQIGLASEDAVSFLCDRMMRKVNISQPCLVVVN